MASPSDDSPTTTESGTDSESDCSANPSDSAIGADGDPTDLTPEPTESTDESTDSTDESTDSTDESTDSTDESTDSTDESTDSTDESTDSMDTDPTDDPTDDPTGPTAGPSGRREVVVPMDLYKVVTVFSTIIAVGLVVLGFVLLDTGTTMLGRGPDEGSQLVGGLVSLAGIGVIVGGAAVYVYATRFRTRGMGKSKDDAGESPE